MDVRHEFPGLSASTYLNSCSHGLLPTRSRRAIEAHLDRWATRPDWGAWMADVDAARAAFARLIHASPDEVAVVSNASEGISAVLGALQPGARRDLVTTDLDFPAAGTLAHRATARGFRHTTVRTSPRPVTAREFAAHLGPETALATIPAVGSFTGYRFDAAEFARVAHAAGAPILVDAFQAAGTFDIDVKKLDVDFLVAGVYKWLMGPPGLAFLYVRRDHLDASPLPAGWQAHADPYQFDPAGALAPDARRYQSGGPSVIGCVGAVPSLALLQEVGLANVERHNARLVSSIVEKADARKWEVVTPRESRASIVTFRVPDLERGLARLAAENVVVNPRLGGIRASPHLYNDEADVERLFEVLDEAIA